MGRGKNTQTLSMDRQGTMETAGLIYTGRTIRCATRLNETQVETITLTRTWRDSKLETNTRTQDLSQEGREQETRLEREMEQGRELQEGQEEEEGQA